MRILLQLHKILPVDKEVFVQLILTSLLKYIYKIGLMTVPVFANSIDKMLPRRGDEIPSIDNMHTVAYGVQLM